MQPPNPLVSAWVMVTCTGAQIGLSFDAQLHGVHSTCSPDHILAISGIVSTTFR